MKIFMVLAAILGLAVLASADSIDYASGGSGSDAIVTGAPKAGSTWSVTDDLVAIDDATTGRNITGKELGTVDITSGKLASCSTGLCFTGGSVVIKTENGQVLADEMFTTGTITMSGGNTFLNANLKNGGTTEIESKSGVFSSNTIVGANATVPEPNALWLMGSGLIGLSFVRRLIK